jgi:perosamine synthetase
MNIRLFKPSLGEEELQAVKEAFDRSWVGLGPKVNEFEQAWQKFTGAQIAIALNSATAALHLALAVFRFPEGKKVLVPSLTFSSTASVVLYNRLIPVFVDSDPVTLGISLEDLERKYDKDCVAVIPVHYAGHPVPMEKLIPWAKEKELKVIEDCAHSIGSIYKGKMLGTWGEIGCYSFEEKKLMTTGDGGMMVTDDPDLFKDVKAMRWVGIDKDNWRSAKQYTEANHDAMHWFYELKVLGYKYNMNDLAASIGLVQLSRLDKMNLSRAKIIRMYLNGIKDIKNIKPILPFEPENYNYWLFGIRSERRDELMIYLKAKGIATGCHYTPLSCQPLFKPFARGCEYIEQEGNKLLTLPLHSELTTEEINYILDNISRF